MSPDISIKPLNIIRVVFALIILISTPLARAQLEEVIVTATKRAQSLQDVPVSVVALTGKASKTRLVILYLFAASVRLAVMLALSSLFLFFTTTFTWGGISYHERRF